MACLDRSRIVRVHRLPGPVAAVDDIASIRVEGAHDVERRRIVPVYTRVVRLDGFTPRHRAVRLLGKALDPVESDAAVVLVAQLMHFRQ